MARKKTKAVEKKKSPAKKKMTHREEPSKEKFKMPKLLTAEGWKRLIMKRKKRK